MFVSVFLVAVLLTMAIMTVYEYYYRKELREIIITEETIALDTLTRILGKDLTNVLTDLEFLKEELLMHQNDDEEVMHLWTNFMKAKSVYDQVRFIDVSGQELYRVNYNQGNIAVVDASALQDKASRYYFKESINLNHNEIYVSKFDLNVENGEIEQPIKPMIRVAIRIKQDELDGILIFNYLADYVLRDLEMFDVGTKGEFYLINSGGYYLYHEDESKQFRFMYDDRAGGNFELDYPGIVARHYNRDYVVENNELFIVNMLNSESMINGETRMLYGNEELLLVSHVKGDESNAIFDMSVSNLLRSVLKNSIGSFLMVFLGALIFAVLQYRIKKSKKIVKEMFEKDALTEVYNRRAGMNYFTEMVNTSYMNTDELSVIFIDVDGLKQINDSLGHEFGDDLLVSIVNIILEEIRDDDLFMRLGGDEFLLVINRIGLTGSSHVMKRIEERIESENQDNEKPFIMSISYGITSTYEENTHDVTELMRIADEKMYEQKNKKDRSHMLKG